MRIVVILLALVLVALAGLSAAAGQLPALAPYWDIARPYAPWATLGVAALMFLLTLVWSPRAAAPPAPVVAPAPPPPPLAPVQLTADAEVVNFLGLLQEKGRLIDFLMDDIARYSDAEVGAAGRVLHEGCKSVLTQHFGVSAIRTESEGATVTVPAGYAPDQYRLVGRISGEAPFSGTLVHHGWKADWVKLPRLVRAGERLPALAPAEVELK